MQNLSLVPRYKIEKDPRNLAYLFPSMPLAKFSKATDEYFHLKALLAVESIAKMVDHILVPAACFHWQRKKQLQHRNVRVIGRSYYVLMLDDLSDMEKAKYEDMIGEISP